MSRSVSKETSESKFQEEKTNIDNFKTALGSTKGTYTGALATISNNVTLAAQGISGWAADDVQVKLDDFIADTLQPGIEAIENDITGGSYNGMVTTTGTLSTELAECKTLKKQWEDAKVAADTAKTTYDNTKSTIEGETHGNYTQPDKPNPAKAENKKKWEAAVKTRDDLETSLEEKCKSVNDNFTKLTTYTFSFSASSGGSTGGDNGGSSDSGQNNNPDGTTLQSGDTVKVGDTALVYVGTLPDGTNLYRNPVNNRIMYQNADGELVQSNADYSWFMNNGANVNGDVVYPGDMSWETTYPAGTDVPCEKITSGQVRGEGQTPSEGDTAGDTSGGETAGETGGETGGETAGETSGGETAAPAAAEPVTVVYGDTVTVGDYSAMYIGTTESGINLYKDPNTEYIYYQTSDGEMHKSNADYTHYVNYGANVNGEVIGPGDTSNSAVYQNGADAPFTFVASGGYESYQPYSFPDSSSEGSGEDE